VTGAAALVDWLAGGVDAMRAQSQHIML